MIEFEYKNVNYRLGYNRKTIADMAKMGLNLNQLAKSDDTIATASEAQWDYWVLFRGAFLLNHRGTSEDLIDEIYKLIPDKTTMIGELAKEYTAFFADLIDDNKEQNAKNAITWKKA